MLTQTQRLQDTTYPSSRRLARWPDQLTVLGWTTLRWILIMKQVRKKIIFSSLHLAVANLFIALSSISVNPWSNVNYLWWALLPPEYQAILLWYWRAQGVKSWILNRNWLTYLECLSLTIVALGDFSDGIWIDTHSNFQL